MLSGNLLRHLKSLNIVLASQSPRRKELLENFLSLPIRCVPSLVDENIDKTSCSSPEDYVLKTCLLKSNAVLSLEPSAHIIIAADTIVVCDTEILEKPSNKVDCLRMMNLLSGKSHLVMTAVTIQYNISGTRSTHSFVEKTEVYFSKLNSEIIDNYANSSEPYDKAGGYGIQSPGGSSFISKINGCYYNVMGLPLNRLCTTFMEKFSDC